MLKHLLIYLLFPILAFAAPDRSVDTYLLRFYEASPGTNIIRIISPSLSADYTLTLPTTDGNSGEVLSTNGSGVLSWITAGGTSADVFVTAVRTGGPGHNGLSFLIIERSDGVSTSKIKTSYSGAASTALVMFENVRVPRENLVGAENMAFKMIKANRIVTGKHD